MLHPEITKLFHRLRAGRDEDAAAELWNLYYPRLVDVARRGLGNQPRRMADEEDVACSAMRSFFQATENGRLNEIQNRDELWKVLLTFTIRKTNRHKRYLKAEKRTPLPQPESSGAHRKAADPVDVEQLADDQLVDELMVDCQDLVRLLPNDVLRKIALQRLEGYSVKEIAALHNVVPSTIKRKLGRIRDIWNEAGFAPPQ